MPASNQTFWSMGKKKPGSNHKYIFFEIVALSGVISVPLQAVAQLVTPLEDRTIPTYPSKHIETLSKASEITISTQRLQDARINPEAINGREKDLSSPRIPQSGATISPTVQSTTTLWSDNKALWKIEFPSGITCAINSSDNLSNSLCQ